MVKNVVSSRTECFKPVAGANARVLILGSFPGELSLEKQQYYAHPRNGFWNIMADILGFDPGLVYQDRITRLKENRIALWDVMWSCSRQGSLDSAIETSSIVVNDFASLFENCPDLTTIIFNGSKAETEFVKHVLPVLDDRCQRLARLRLPSTSPALATLSLQQKTAAWRVVCGLLHGA